MPRQAPTFSHSPFCFGPRSRIATQQYPLDDAGTVASRCTSLSGIRQALLGVLRAALRPCYWTA